LSKSHRREGPEQRPPQQERPPEREDLLPDAEVADLWARGNQAAREQLGAEGPSGSSPAREAARSLVERAATALRIVPREAAWTERLVAIVEGSALPPERREVLSMRLRTDQATADEVAAAVATHLGADSEALRQSLLQALEEAGQHASSGPEPQGTLSDRTEGWMAEVTAERAGLPSESVRGLLRDLVLLVAFGWDEEEEGPLPGDYAAEESGW
jgi:hypothetical protein